MNAPAILLLNLANKLITLANGNRISAFLSERMNQRVYATDRVANIR
jgi:hypothetical protein